MALLGCAVIPSSARAENAYLPELIQNARQLHLSEDPYWRLLLHVRRNVYGRLQSDIDEPFFFLSAKGRRDPELELEATLAAFFQPPPVDLETTLHPQCRYPARYAWLIEKLQLDSRLPAQPCERLQKWKENMRAESISLIFASYYLNNPASMYGHTFFRINAAHHGPDEHLLDYAVNFGADVGHDNGILFAVRGLLGGYRGRFSTLPYYVKVQEYNNLESRDLWEYRLTLEKPEVERFMNHLWEMGSASMAYFFLNKNCSYQLLPLLEVARPSLTLVRPFWVRTVPVDTLKQAIRQPGLLAEVQQRRSHLSLMLARRAQLSVEEVRMAEHLATQPADLFRERLAAYTPVRQAAILDSAYDLFRYRYGFKRPQPKMVMEKERELLLLRQQRPPATHAPKTMAVVSPQDGHPTARMGLSYGFSRKTQFEEFSVRAAAHDQDESSDGFLAGSKLEMAHLKIRRDHATRDWYLEQLALVDLVSLSPIDGWIRKPSWNFKMGVATARDLDRDPSHTLHFGVHAGAGPAVRLPIRKNTFLYSMVDIDAGVGAPFRDVYRLGGGVSGGILYEYEKRVRLRFHSSYLNYPVGDPSEAVKLQWMAAFQLSPRLALRGTLERQNHQREALISALWSW